MKRRQVTRQLSTPWPFLYSVTPEGRLVKNVPADPPPPPKPPALRSGQK